jgi:hypothetical protein
MSANNLLVILKPAKDRYEVWMKDAESGCFMGEPKKAKTLKTALRKAMKWLKEEDIEYGLRYVEW